MTLSDSLLAAQKSPTRTPYVTVEAGNTRSGVVNLKWSRLYTGAEADSGHAITIPGDGSLIRLRNTPAGDSYRLYYQRVTSPGPGSDFSQWTYLNEYNVRGIAACSLGDEVSLVFVRGDGEIARYVSLDCGATMQRREYIGYAPTGDVTGIAAACKPGGDLAVFFTHYQHLYLFERVSGVWEFRGNWEGSVGGFGSVALVYDGDWKLLLSGQAPDSDYKVWSMIYGDGGEVPAGEWSGLKEITSAPYGSNFTFGGLFMDKAEVYRCSFIEDFSGVESYNRPYLSHVLPGTTFADCRWREPLPFDLESRHGLAMAHYGDWYWLAVPCGIWRASLVQERRDLSADVLAVKLDLAQDRERMTLELKNELGQYALAGGESGSLPGNGCQITLCPGYITSQGSETGAEQLFTVEACEYVSARGKASLMVYAAGGWAALEKWSTRCQLRWNKPDGEGEPVQEAPVREILAQVMARAGIRLAVLSSSGTAAGFYPDFTVHAGDNGHAVVTRLLSFIPDALILEGLTGYLLNPLPEDQAVYSYRAGEQAPGAAPAHPILEGWYRREAAPFNRVLVEGLDPALASPLAVESYDWEEVGRSGDRLEMVEDLNVSSVSLARDRGAAWIRRASFGTLSGSIRIPVNCGQQICDVIGITDPCAALLNVKRRVLGISLSYLPGKGTYDQVLKLGGV